MTSIAHLTHTPVLTDARILRELNALGSEEGLEVHAYGARAASPGTGTRRFEVTEFMVQSSRATRLPRGLRYALVMLELNARILRRLVADPVDVVHCHDAMVLPAGAIARAAFGSTLVYDAHELESDKNGQSAALSKATLLVERAAWPLVDALISVSPSIIAWYDRHLGPKASLCLLNSPEIRRAGDSGALASPARLRSVLGIRPNEKLYVYVGELSRGRGLRVIAEVFSGGEVEAHVAFVGEGEDRALIERLSAEHPNIHRCEPVPHDSLVDFISDADGGFCLIEDVSLSDHYCLPNKLFEYAFAGLPVIASRLPDISDYVQRYSLGTCIDIDAGQLHEVVTHGLPKDHGPRERLRPLSWQAQADNLRAFYCTLIKRRSHRRSLRPKPHEARV